MGLSRQGMELWRPDWCKIYRGDSSHLPDVDGELLSVTHETCRLAASALRTVCEQDYDDTYGAAMRELMIALGDWKEDKNG